LAVFCFDWQLKEAAELTADDRVVEQHQAVARRSGGIIAAARDAALDHAQQPAAAQLAGEQLRGAGARWRRLAPRAGAQLRGGGGGQSGRGGGGAQARRRRRGGRERGAERGRCQGGHAARRARELERGRRCNRERDDQAGQHVAQD
jgi:hypothetical protein